MGMELLYTSAPKGLKPGTRGFCTVAMTQGVPPQLVERLESLSGYRQVFAPQDPQAALNPVVQSHLRISIAGRNYHVLSRICAAGLDYSQRNNKFAHHLVLDPRELSPAGPAWTLAQPAVMETVWDGTPRLLAGGRRMPSGNVAPAVCRAWQQLTGDAGWGGVLAEAAIERPKSPVTIIFRPGVDPLPLIAESLALLPPEQRWNVTFSTYFTKLPPGVECQWRCALEGSVEAKGAQGLVIDLCRALAAAQDGQHVTAARTGKLAAFARVATRASSVIDDDIELENLLQSLEPGKPHISGRIPAPTPVAAASLEPLPPVLPPRPATSNSRFAFRNPSLKGKVRWPIIAAATAFILIVGGGTAALLISRNKSDAQDNESLSQIAAHNNERADKEKTDKEKTLNVKTDAQKSVNDKPDTQEPDKEKPDKEKADKEKADKEKADREKADKHAREVLDSLPSCVAISLRAGSAATSPIPIAEFDFGLARECRLSLLGREGAFGAGACELKAPNATSPAQLIEWTCEIDGSAQGKFIFSASGLDFRWLDVARSPRDIQRMNQLRNCVLQFRVGSQPKRIALRAPKSLNPLPLSPVDQNETSIQPKKSRPMDIEYPPIAFEPKVELVEITGLPSGYLAVHPSPADLHQLNVRKSVTNGEALNVPLTFIASASKERLGSESVGVPVQVSVEPRPQVEKWRAYFPRKSVHAGSTTTPPRVTSSLIEVDILPGLKRDLTQTDIKKDRIQKERDSEENRKELKAVWAERADLVSQIEEAQWLNECLKALLTQNPNAVARYRVYMDVEDYRVELLEAIAAGGAQGTAAATK